MMTVKCVYRGAGELGCSRKGNNTTQQVIKVESGRWERCPKNTNTRIQLYNSSIVLLTFESEMQQSPSKQQQREMDVSRVELAEKLKREKEKNTRKGRPRRECKNMLNVSFQLNRHEIGMCANTLLFCVRACT